MAIIDDILSRYDEFVSKALSTDPQVSADADAAYRDMWGVFDGEERMYLSIARMEVRDMDGAPEDFHVIAAEVRARLVARLSQ